MKHDLKIIKKKYGEDMAHFCRTYFSTLLETEGLLPRLLFEHFEPNKFLWKDMVEQNAVVRFKNYINSLIYDPAKDQSFVDKTPEELMNLAGYDLYECKTEEDVQSFKKYYAKGEELSTFHGGRLNHCRIFFAVKKKIDRIKREDFPCPKRQDAYGTSVISIQFTKDDSHILSIKNRYNHRVCNPDATFDNNLNNIMPGLADSFAKYYHLKQDNLSAFSLDGYVLAQDGKFYKYNYEKNNIYYCPKNIIIDNLKVKRFDKNRYILLDYFLIDKKRKKIKVYDAKIEDGFVQTYQNIDEIIIDSKKGYKKIKLLIQGQIVILKMDATNRLISIKDPVSKCIPAHFCSGLQCLEKVDIPNACFVDNYFCYHCPKLEEVNVNLIKVERVGENFHESCGVKSPEEQIGIAYASHESIKKYLGLGCGEDPLKRIRQLFPNIGSRYNDKTTNKRNS